MECVSEIDAELLVLRLVGVWVRLQMDCGRIVVVGKIDIFGC